MTESERKQSIDGWAARSFSPAHVCLAARFNPNTLRKLNIVEPFPLRLDANEGREGWRQYSRADAVRVAIVRDLMVSFTVPLGTAVPFVNSLFDTVAMAVKQFDAHLVRHNEYPVDPYPLVLVADITGFSAPHYNAAFFGDEKHFLSYLAKRGFGPNQLIISVMAHVRRVNLRLQDAVRATTGEGPDD